MGFWHANRLFFVFSTIWLPIAFTGCGKAGVASVSGTVVHQDGTPVVGARIIARSSESGKSANGETDANGHYELSRVVSDDGVLPGEYYVIVMEDRGDENQRRPATIAAKYTKPATSGLKFSVQPGEKTTFDMKLDPR
jgi:hypothetical protein